MSTGLQTAKEAEIFVTKIPVKLTEKALFFKIEGLERARKPKLKEAAAFKGLILKLLCEPGYNNEVKSNFDKYYSLVNDAKDARTALVKLLPLDKKEKHEIWFKAKLLSIKDLSQRVTDY